MKQSSLLRRSGLAILFSAALALLACSAAQVIKDPPRVNLVSIDVEQATVFEQRYLLTLRLQNHNPTAISISGLSFDLFVNDKLFASGVSDQPLELKGFGEAALKVHASSTAFAMYRQIMVLAEGRQEELTFRLAGKLGLGGLSSLPFEKKGSLSFKPESSGKMGFTAQD